MKKAALPALLLVIFTAANLFAETPDCRHSFDLGWNDAEELHKSRGWYWIGAAAGFSALGVYVAVDNFLWDPSEFDPESGPGGEKTPASPLPLLCAVSVLAAPAVPARLFPKRKTILPVDDGSNLECYRQGYSKRARWKNTRSLLYGELTAGGVILLGGFLLAVAIYTGEW